MKSFVAYSHESDLHNISLDEGLFGNLFQSIIFLMRLSLLITSCLTDPSFLTVTVLFNTSFFPQPRTNYYINAELLSGGRSITCKTAPFNKMILPDFFAASTNGL